MLYADDDGTVDVNFTDRDGKPWFWYRAREREVTQAVRAQGAPKY